MDCGLRTVPLTRSLTGVAGLGITASVMETGAAALVSITTDKGFAEGSTWLLNPNP